MIPPGVRGDMWGQTPFHLATNNHDSSTWDWTGSARAQKVSRSVLPWQGLANIWATRQTSCNKKGKKTSGYWIALKAWGDLVTERACKAGWYCSLHGSISKSYSNILKCNINSNFLVLTHQIRFTINIHTIQSLTELRLTDILRLSSQRDKKCNLYSLPKYTPSIRRRGGQGFRQAKARKYRVTAGIVPLLSHIPWERSAIPHMSGLCQSSFA